MSHTNPGRGGQRRHTLVYLFYFPRLLRRILQARGIMYCPCSPSNAEDLDIAGPSWMRCSTSCALCIVGRQVALVLLCATLLRRSARMPSTRLAQSSPELYVEVCHLGEAPLLHLNADFAGSCIPTARSLHTTCTLFLSSSLRASIIGRPEGPRPLERGPGALCHALMPYVAKRTASSGNCTRFSQAAV